MSRNVIQTAFKPYNQVLYGMNNDTPFYERGALVQHNRFELMRNMYGVPTDLANNLITPQYTQPMDIVAQYRNRALPVPTQMVTAAMVNSQASFLTVASPVFLTSEKNFISKHREINQIEFSQIAQAGIPHEQTSTEVSWNTTVRKFSLTFPMLLDYALDENFGAQEWAFQLGGLAANAMLTVYKQIAYGFVHIAYENIVSNHMKNIPFDLSKLLLKESESFLVAASNPDLFMRLIRDFEDDIPGANMVIIRKGAAAYIEKMKGESTTMAVQRISNDPETNRLMIELDELTGPRTIKTVYYGDRYYQFVEMPNFKVNMDDDRTEQPLRTAATICQVIPPDPDLTADVSSAQSDDINDPYVYYQTKNHGERVRLSYVQGLRHSFYWQNGDSDDGRVKDGQISALTYDFCNKKNAGKSRPGDGNGAYLDREWSDNNTPESTDDIQGYEDIRQMKKFREEFVGLTWVNQLQKFVVPKKVGSFHLRHLPNDWVRKTAYAIAEAINCYCPQGTSSDSSLDDVIDLLDNISKTKPTQAYLQAVIDANAPFNFDSDGKFVGETTQSNPEYPNASELREWRGNEFGSLRLPKRDGLLTETYPWGFDSGPGLLTLAKEADKESSDWAEAGQQAKKAVRYLTMMEKAVNAYVGNSDMTNSNHTLPWFHKKHSLTTLVDSLRGPRAPVFLAIPSVAKDTFSAKKNPFTSSTSVAFQTKENRFRACLATGTSLPNLTLDSDISKRIIDTVQNIVISTCGWNEKQDSPRTIAYVTILALYIYNAVEKADGTEQSYLSIEEELSLLSNTSKGSKLNSIINSNSVYGELWSNKTLKNEKVKAYKEEQALLGRITDSPISGKSIDERRKEYEQAERNYSEALRTGTGVEQARMARDNARVVAGVSSGSSGKVYIDESTDFNYRRSPLMASESLNDYVSETEYPLALPADPSTLYETPMRVKSYPVVNDSEIFGTSSQFGSLPFSFAFKQKRSSSQEESFSSPSDDDIFGSLKSTKKSSSFGSDEKSFSMSDYLSGSASSSFGRTYELEERSSGNNVSNAYKRRQLLEDTGRFTLESDYIGPWSKRIDYMRKHVQGITAKMIFLAIISAPNELRSFEAPAKIGQKLINVMFIRPFIEQVVSSALVLEAGASTSLTPIGGVSLTVAKEERGITHTRMDFNTGLIKVNPKNIGMIYGCIPEAHIGGMKVDMMKRKEDFTKRNPEKPSVICMLTPVSEYLYEWPIHLNNLSTYQRPDTSNAHLCKVSFAPFFRHIFGENTLNQIEGLHQERTSYASHVQVSLVGHRSPVAYRDYNLTSHALKDVNGTGPRGDLSMNIGNAYATHNGKATYFPVYNQ